MTTLDALASFTGRGRSEGAYNMTSNTKIYSLYQVFVVGLILTTKY